MKLFLFSEAIKIFIDFGWVFFCKNTRISNLVFTIASLIVVLGVCTAMPQLVFYDESGQRIPNNQSPQLQPAQPTPPSATTAAPANQAGPVLNRAFYRCFDSCPTLSTYNPVCGSDGNNYHNAQKLDCHNSCGREQNPTTWTGKLWVRFYWYFYDRSNCISSLVVHRGDIRSRRILSTTRLTITCDIMIIIIEKCKPIFEWQYANKKKLHQK